MAGNPLSPDSLASTMASSVESLTGPQLRTPYDAIALLAHACMSVLGFRLVGLGEDHRIDAPSGDEARPLPPEWNASPGSSYAFRYSHSQSSMEYLIKVNRMGSKAVVFGMGMGDDRTATFDVAVKDYVSESAFPATLSSDTGTSEGGDERRAGGQGSMTDRLLKNTFISPHRVAEMASLFKVNIIQKVMPGLYKAGYEETPSSTTAHENEGQGSSRRQDPDQERDPPRGDRIPPPARPYPFDDPLALPPRRPGPVADFPPPGFEDEYEIIRPRGALPPDLGGGGRPPLGIGHDDLYPAGLGPHDPLAPGGVGGLRRPGGMGGGMHPSFDDPLFRGQGGEGYDPSRPPGARYDPVGPGDGPPSGLGGGGGGPRFPGGGRGGGGPPNPFGGFGGGAFI